MAASGWKVYLGSRNLQAGKKASAGMNGNIEVIQLDVADISSIKQALERIEQLDVLINNAGVFSEKSVTDFDLQELRNVLEVNLLGVISVIAQMTPLLGQSKDGRIVNISSEMGALDNLNARNVAYRLSKASLNTYTRMLASALAGTIKVNAMCPGWVKTDMGGSSADRSVEQGADTAVWLATAEDIPHGQFLRDRKVMDW